MLIAGSNILGPMPKNANACNEVGGSIQYNGAIGVVVEIAVAISRKLAMDTQSCCRGEGAWRATPEQQIFIRTQTTNPHVITFDGVSL